MYWIFLDGGHIRDSEEASSGKKWKHLWNLCQRLAQMAFDLDIDWVFVMEATFVPNLVILYPHTTFIT
jgi:hypothetical protein